MTQLVLFDFDGTLADTAPDLAEAANKQRRDLGLPDLPDEVLRPMASHGARGLLRAALDMLPDHPDYEARRLRFLRDYEADMTRLTRLFDGIPALLDQLEAHGCRWGIVTNKLQYLALPLVRHLGLEERCAVTVGGDTAGHPKPHPAPLLYAAAQVGIDPASCIYVGDDERDIVAGKAAGMRTIAAAYGYCDPAQAATWQADALVHAPDEIWPTLQSLWSAAAARN